MHHRLGPVFAQYLVEADSVENVALLQRAPTDSPLMPVDEIVIGNRRVAGRCERLARVGPDIAGAARNQYMSSRHRYVLTLTPEITIPKVRDRSPQAFVQRNYGFPLEHLLGQCNVRLPLHGVVARQRLEDDLGSAARVCDHLPGKLEDGELLRVAEVDRAGEIVGDRKSTR